jgi:hypothetical protein
LYRFKTFDSRECADDLRALEARVNAWMDEERPRIRIMCQTPIDAHILVSFVFEVVVEVVEQPAKAITAIPDLLQDTLETPPFDQNEPPPVHGKCHTREE